MCKAKLSLVTSTLHKLTNEANSIRELPHPASITFVLAIFFISLFLSASSGPPKSIFFICLFNESINFAVFSSLNFLSCHLPPAPVLIPITKSLFFIPCFFANLFPKSNSFLFKLNIGSYLKKNQKTYTNNSSLWFDMGLISKFGKQKADILKAKNRKTYQSIIYGIIDLNYKKQEPILSLNKKELDFGKRFAKKHGIKNSDLVIGINTGAGGGWQDKKLSEEKTAKLIDSLNKQIKNIKIILFGGPEEAERNKEIKKIAKTNVIDAGCGNSLMEFASLVNLCKGLVTSDSLALHIGVALEKKIVVVFYFTSANEIELYGRGIKIIGKGKDCCSYKPRCYYTPKWDIGEIVDAIKKLI